MNLRKIVIALLVCSMLLGVMGVSVYAASSVDTWDGTADTSWYDAANPQTSYTIDTAEELAGLAKLVNEGTAFYEKEMFKQYWNTVTFTLTTDIDLANKAWTPVGNGAYMAGEKFAGIFDGGNHTISNLNVSGVTNAGLFGSAGASGGDGLNRATIKNLTISGVTAQGTSTAAAFVGNAFVGVTFDNLTVTGMVKINSDWVAGGITAYGYTDITNCTVNADAGSTINAYEHAGGVIGLLGEGSGSTVVNCETTSVTVTAETYGAGGICGYSFAESTVTECVVESVVVDSQNADYIGAISGGSLGTVSTENAVLDVTTQNNGTPVTAKDTVSTVPVIAKVGTQSFTSLSEAIAAADALTPSGTVQMVAGTFTLGDIRLPQNISNVTIQGATNKGTILKDSSLLDAGSQKFNYSALTIDGIVFDNSTIHMVGWGTNSIIENLAITNCEFRNVGDHGSPNIHAVSFNVGTSAAGGSATFTNLTFTGNIIDGVTTTNASGLQITSVSGTVNVSDNEIINVPFNAIQMQGVPANAVVTMENNILASDSSGGIVNLNNNKATTISIKNNQFLVKDANQPGVYLRGDLDVSANYWNGGAPVTFGDQYYISYYKSVTADGTLTDLVSTHVAEIGENKYPTIQAAVDAAQTGDVIKIVADVPDQVIMPTADSTSNADNCLIRVDAGKKITIDLNGNTISARGHDDAKYDTLVIRNSGDLTITDTSANKAGKIVLNYSGTQENGTSQIHSVILNFGTLTINGGSIENKATSGYSRYGIYNYSWGGNAKTTVNSGTISSDTSYAIFSAVYDDFSRHVNELTITGGTLNGGVYYWHQGATAGATLTISGGTFYSASDNALYVKEPAEGDIDLSISGGAYNTPVKYVNNADTNRKFVTGGNYSEDPAKLCADGYITISNNGMYGVYPEGAAFAISATAIPAETGTVSGTGLYALGQTVTLTATAPEGYRFVKWTEDGAVVSTNPILSFSAATDRHFVAVFEQDPTDFWMLMYAIYGRKFTVNASATEGGTISPAGETSVRYGSSVTYVLTPNAGYQIKSLIVNGEDKGALSIYTIEKVTADQVITAVFEKTAWENPYKDLKETDWYYNDVAFVSAAGLMEGVPGNLFNPADNLSRAMMVTVLWRMAGSPVVDYTMNFTDVKTGEWYTEAVRWAAAEGITNGNGDGTFLPEADVTREQVAIFLQRYAEYKMYESEFASGNIDEYTVNDWSKQNVRWAVVNGIFSNIGVDVSDMTVAASRAEIAAYLCRFCLYIVK